VPTPGACVVDRVAARIFLEGRSPHRLLALWGLLRLRRLSEALDTVQVHHPARRIFSRALSASSSVAFVTERVTRLRRTARISLNLIFQCRLDILGRVLVSVGQVAEAARASPSKATSNRLAWATGSRSGGSLRGHGEPLERQRRKHVCLPNPVRESNPCFAEVTLTVFRGFRDSLRYGQPTDDSGRCPER
jgi:hypothetical protein